MSRYRVDGPWHSESQQGSFASQSARVLDTRNGDTFEGGAWRVINWRTGKAAKRGKGGTVPFWGESAWMDAERLLGDLDMAERFGGAS